MGALKLRHQIEGACDQGSKCGDLLLGKELGVGLVLSTQGLDVVSKGLDHDLDALLILAVEGFLDLFDVHWDGLLEQLNILGLSNGDQHRLEDGKGALLDRLAVQEGHVGGNNGEKRLNEGGESLSKVLADLLEDEEGAGLARESVRVQGDLLLTHSLDLHIHGEVVRGGWHISRLHLEVNIELAIVHQFGQKQRHKLHEFLAKEVGALGECIFDSLILRVRGFEASLHARGQVLSDLEHISLEWFFVLGVGDRGDDGADGLDGAGAQILAFNGLGTNRGQQAYQDGDEGAEVLREVFLDDVCDGSDERENLDLESLMVLGDALLEQTDKSLKSLG